MTQQATKREKGTRKEGSRGRSKGRRTSLRLKWEDPVRVLVCFGVLEIPGVTSWLQPGS